MDPTKPILDLYGEYDRRKTSHLPSQGRRSVPNNGKAQRSTGHSDISYSQLKQKYQQLYESYNQKTQKLQQTQYQSSHYRSQNQKLKEQMYKLNQTNDKLNASLLAKNGELQDAYRKLQEQLRRGGKGRKYQQTIDRLQDGLKEAINVNFQHLREASLAQLKRCLPRT